MLESQSFMLDLRSMYICQFDSSTSAPSSHSHAPIIVYKYIVKMSCCLGTGGAKLVWEL